MRFTSRFDPRAGAADLWEYLREPRPYRWPILAVSIAIPLAGVAMLTQESHFRPPDAPKVNFISTFAEGRSDEEIRQSNLVNQQRKEAREAEFHAEFLVNTLGKIEWDAFVGAAREIGEDDALPANKPADAANDESFLRAFHHALLEVHVQEGYLVCPDSGRRFPITKGIPNMLLNEDEV